MSNQNHITELHIENFKSIKNMDLKPKRINIFVGKPNVGKSNILEALSIISRRDHLHDVIRFNRTYQLFYDNEPDRVIKIFTNTTSAFVARRANNNQYNLVIYSDAFPQNEKILEVFKDNDSNSIEKVVEEFDNFNGIRNELLGISWHSMNEEGRNESSSFHGVVKSNIKRYSFKEDLNIFTNAISSFLEPPFGANLLKILLNNKSLRENVSSFFNEYKLEFLVNQNEKRFELIKKVDGISTTFDYSLTADTLRRAIFHVAAIKSNKNSVLIFEEPESHSFPPYISQIAQEMIDSKTNQFFVATHSPYLLNKIVENDNFDECAVFVCSYKDYQTHLRELSNDEMSEMLNYGTDVFINYDAFVE